MSKLQNILNKIFFNLEKLENFSDSRIFKVSLKNNDKSLNQRKSYNKGFERKIFFLIKLLIFLECSPEDK